MLDMIGGNLQAVISIRDVTINDIGEQENKWHECIDVVGWLDYMGGTANTQQYDTRIENSTHVFIMDYRPLYGLTADYTWDNFCFLWDQLSDLVGTGDDHVQATEENAMMNINGKRYYITGIDDPMELHDHLEIFLRYTGGQ